MRLNKLVVLSLVTLFTLCVININDVNASVRKEQILFEGQNLYMGLCSYRYSGPYAVSSGRTITVEWVADRLVTVYILNDVDYRQWLKIGGPPYYRTYKTAQQGTLEYYVSYTDNFYIVVMGYAGQAAKLYNWKEKLVWYENSVPEFTQLTIMILITALLSVTIIALIRQTQKPKKTLRMKRRVSCLVV